MGDHPDIACAMATGYAQWEQPHHVGRCVGCGEVICGGESVFRSVDGRLVHEDCFIEYVLDRFGVDEIAEQMGFDKEVAE